MRVQLGCGYSGTPLSRRAIGQVENPHHVGWLWVNDFE